MDKYSIDMELTVGNGLSIAEVRWVITPTDVIPVGRSAKSNARLRLSGKKRYNFQRITIFVHIFNDLFQYIDLKIEAVKAEIKE